MRYESRLRIHWHFFCILGIATFIHIPIFGDGLNPDATTYMEVSKSLYFTGSLQIETSLVPRHPPLMSIVFLPFGVSLGFTEFAVHTLQLLLMLLDLVVLYLISLRFGRIAALVPPIFLGLDPVLYLNMSEGRSLALLILFVQITLWGIWKGLGDSRWLPITAAAASLGFLTADSVGYLFLVAGIAGFFWRFYYVRWTIFRDRGYWVAAAVLLSTVGVWTLVNLAEIGSPYTDPRVALYLNQLFVATPIYVSAILVAGLATYFFLYVSQAAIPFLLLRRGRTALTSLPRRIVHDQKVGALVLFIVVTISIASIVSAAFLLHEPLRTLGSADTYLRYAATVAPLTYLAIAMHLRPAFDSRRFVQPIAVIFLSVAILAPHFVSNVERGDGNSFLFEEVSRELRARGHSRVHSEVSIFFRYNIPEIEWVAVDKGYSDLQIVLTESDVPRGSPLLTRIYVPPAFDWQIGGFYLVNSFDPTVHSPLVNAFHR